MIKEVCLYRRGKVRWIAFHDLLINKNTPRGEPASLYERKPYGGKRSLEGGELLGRVIAGYFKISDCSMTRRRFDVIMSLGLKVSRELFYNGAVYTTVEDPFQTLKQALARDKRKG